MEIELWFLVADKPLIFRSLGALTLIFTENIEHRRVDFLTPDTGTRTGMFSNCHDRESEYFKIPEA